MTRARSRQEKKRDQIDDLAIALISLILQAGVLVVLSIYLPGLAVLSLEGAALFVLVLGLANSFLIFPLISLSIRLHPLLFPLMLFSMNGILVLLAGSIFPDVSISSIWTAILVSFVISTTGMVVGGAFAVDDSHSYQRFVIRPLMERYGSGKRIEVPGVVFLEIDGLSEEMLHKAVFEGYMPTVKRWLESGSHRLAGWDTDLSCQTGGSQPGILHGNNFNIPGFRWFEKSSQKLYSSDRPGNVSEIEDRVSDSRGLLADNGSSRTNMYSGDAPESLLTVSTIGAGKKGITLEYFLFFANPFMLARTAGIFVSHLVEEMIEGSLQWARRERPRINRFGYYPFIRALATAVLRELAIFALAGDMIRSLPVMYATFVGYDEVAHHSGVARKDALRVLRGLDKMFGWLEELAEATDRPYRFVVLSDHGQSNGATFRQRTGKTLEEVVEELVELETFSPPSEDETWLRVNSLLTDISRQDSRSGRLVGRAVRGRMKEGGVVLGPKVKDLGEEDGDDKSRRTRRGTDRSTEESIEESIEESTEESIEESIEESTDRSIEKYIDKPINRSIDEPIDKAIVLASGNLGLIYFTASKERLSLEEINRRYPHLISGLLRYPEIGFLMVRSAAQGPLVIGAKGIYHLWEGWAQGEDPLESYGRLAPRQLIYEDSFDNCPDILVNSFYSQETDEVAAFEELVGSHGGLGGSQTKGILIYPADLPLSLEPIVGASSLHRAIKQWVPAE